ncbi:MAG: RHS repeat-associated core domain-containing protein [Bacteroidales bacterium]
MAVYVKENTTETLYHAETDHLGSLVALRNTNGNVAESYSYEPWARRRNSSDWSYTNVPVPVITNRGFTGHEHLDKFGLINMIGRLYDPVLGRFLNADPVIQFPGFTQSYNSYSYVMNNPLRFTDPTGYTASMDAFTEAGQSYKSLAEQFAELFGEMYYDVYLSHLFDEEYQGPIYQGPTSLIFKDGSYYTLDGKKLTTEEAKQHIMRNTEIANPQGQGGEGAIAENLRRCGMCHHPDGFYFDEMAGLREAFPILVTGMMGIAFQGLSYLSLPVKVVSGTPNFVVSKGGTAFPVPKGATGPIPASSGKGFQFIEGVGGNGLSYRVSGFRFMEPVTTGKYQYPGGYGSYFNKAGQTINPFTGQTISSSNPWWHIPAKK